MSGKKKSLQHPVGNQYLYIVGQLITRSDFFNNVDDNGETQEEMDDADIEYVFDLAQKIVDRAKERRKQFLNQKEEKEVPIEKFATHVPV